MKDSEIKLLSTFDVEINVKDVVSIRSTCDAMLKAFSDSPQSPVQTLALKNDSTQLHKVNFAYSITTKYGETYVVGDDVCLNGLTVKTTEDLEKIESALFDLSIVFAMFKWAERKRRSVSRLKTLERALREGAQA
jgi:hypothetical protein